MVNNVEIITEEVFKSSNVVERKISLPDGADDKIISVTAVSNITETEVLDGEIVYGGKTVFTILYDDNGAISKQEAGVEFSYKIQVKGVKNGDIVWLTAKTSGEKASTLNGITTVSAVVTVTAISAQKNVVETALITNDFLTKTAEAETLTEVSCLVKTAVIEDEFELNYAVKDVLCHDERMVLKTSDAGIGVINLSGELEVTAYLNKLDGDDVVKEVKTIPFNLEFECADVYPACVVSTEITVNDCLIKAYVDEGKNKSNFAIECTVSILSKAFENVKYNVVLDAYSVSNELSLQKERILFNKVLRRNVCMNTVNGEILAEISKNDRLICVFGVKIENEEYELIDNSLNATGILSAVAVYKGDNGLNKVEITAPYNVNCPLNGNSFNLAKVKASGVDIRLTPNGFSYSYNLYVYYNDILNQTETIVKTVELGNEKVKNTSAISVFVPKKGETLWDASKALGVSEEEILKYNENLETPFTGEERVIIFREVN